MKHYKLTMKAEDGTTVTNSGSLKPMGAWLVEYEDLGYEVVAMESTEVSSEPREVPLAQQIRAGAGITWNTSLARR